MRHRIAHAKGQVLEYTDQELAMEPPSIRELLQPVVESGSSSPPARVAVEEVPVEGLPVPPPAPKPRRKNKSK